jgi:predicted DNA-binding transcriptional regulator AlpA
MAEDNYLWTPRELAKFLGYSESTICRLVSQYSEGLPPRVTALPRPRWLPEVARERARTNSNPPIARIGRPRNVR